MRFMVEIKKLRPEAKLPSYKTIGSAGCDVCSVEEAVIKPGERKMIPLGFSIQIPTDYECQVRPRSGLAFSSGVTVLNSPGTVDWDYRGEMKVLLYNTGNEDVVILAGDRIAQLVFAPVIRATFKEIEELDETERGAGGWGSTGKAE